MKLKIPAGAESVAFGSFKAKADANGFIVVTDDKVANHLIAHGGCERIAETEPVAAAPAAPAQPAQEPEPAPVAPAPAQEAETDLAQEPPATDNGADLAG